MEYLVYGVAFVYLVGVWRMLSGAEPFDGSRFPEWPSWTYWPIIVFWPFVLFMWLLSDAVGALFEDEYEDA